MGRFAHGFERSERDATAQPMSEINVTPLVDVMLVLLVIFIITAPLLSYAIQLELPNDVAPAAEPVSASRQALNRCRGQVSGTTLPWTTKLCARG